MSDGPVEIKLTLDKTAVQRDLARMKEKVRSGQGATAPGQLPGVKRPDSGRVSEVDRALERERDERIRSGGGESSFLQDIAAGGLRRAGTRAILGAAEAGEFGAFAAGATRFAGGVVAAGGAVLTGAMIAKGMAESMVQIAPLIVGVINDYLKENYPALYEMAGKDAEEFTAWITGKVNEGLAKIDSMSALREAADVEFARARLGQETQFKNDFDKLQKFRENESKLKRKIEAETLERTGRELVKQLRRGAG